MADWKLLVKHKSWIIIQMTILSDNINVIQCVPQVRYKMHCEPLPAPAPRRPPARRISTRRSSYAFSHSQGYGNLVMSRKFLLRPTRLRPSLIHSDSAVAQSQPQHYRTITEEPEGSRSP